ncbi:terminase small subunit-like protein [Heyndrickxia sporothermodurans]
MSNAPKKRRTTNAQRAAARPKPPKPTGRPTSFDEATKEEIIRRIENGETLSAVCRSKHLPERWSVYRYARTDESFSAALACARVAWADVMADELLVIADDSQNDWQTRTFAGRTELVPNREVVDRSKVKIDVRRYLMSCFNKHRYSEDARKINPADTGDVTAEIKKDQTVIAPDEPGPKKPVL